MIYVREQAMSGPARAVDLGDSHWAVECDECPHRVVIHRKTRQALRFLTGKRARRHARLHNEFAHREAPQWTR